MPNQTPKIIVDIERVAELMTAASVDPENLDNWTDTLMDILEEEYDLETLVNIAMNAKPPKEDE